MSRALFFRFISKSWRIFPRHKSPRNSPHNHHQFTTFQPLKTTKNTHILQNPTQKPPKKN
jgi:hypothetical protein